MFQALYKMGGKKLKLNSDLNDHAKLYYTIYFL